MTSTTMGGFAAGTPRLCDAWKAARAEKEKGVRRELVLRLVQPTLAGLTDGSVSTLAPLFAAAFATGDHWKAFLIGMAGSLGAGISMAFAEMSDDGVVSGRGPATPRAVACGLATTLGGVGHTLPFLCGDFRTAIAGSLLVVCAELWAIAWVRHRYMDTPMRQSMVQVILGGATVVAVGVALGGAGGAG